MIGKCNRDLSTTLMRLLHTTAGRVGSRSLLLEIGGCRDPETLGDVIHRKCADFERIHWITALRRFAQLNPDHLSSDTRLTLKVCLSLPVRNLDFRAVSDLVWALGTLGSSRAAAQPFVDHSVRLVRLSTASPDLQRVAALLVGIARGKFERGCLMLALEDRLCCDGSWKGRDVSLCLWALGRFSYEGKLVDVLADWVTQAGPSGMSEQDWSVALFNLGRLGRFDLALVPRASGRMNDSRNIATLLWSAGQAEGGARILWRAVKDHYDVLSDRLLPADIPQVMWALTRIDNSKALGTLALRLAEKLKNSNWVPMNRLEINNVAYGLHWTGVMDLPLYQWLHSLMSAHSVKLPARKASPGVIRKIPEEVVDGATEPLVVYSGLGGVSIVYKPNAWTTEMAQSFLGESLVLAHRIDFGTSGPLMGTTSGAEEAVLALQQQAGLVVKKYWCLVEGILMEKEGKIEARIENLETWCVVSEDGKPAVTKYTVRREFKSVGVSLVECRLLSGRKHQIRVHMASLGHPLVMNKYYPPDFDPSKLLPMRMVKKPRVEQRGPKCMNIRMMLPFSMCCSHCGEYLYIATKFNSRCQKLPEKSSLGLNVYRFYGKCKHCLGEFSFRTDPEHSDYVLETGGTRTYEGFKDADFAEAEVSHRKTGEENESETKAMENKIYDTAEEMRRLDELDELKAVNR
ncbi:Coiled-coil domain-containing protein 94, partial [Perkinsus olseni]